MGKRKKKQLNTVRCRTPCYEDNRSLPDPYHHRYIGSTFDEDSAAAFLLWRGSVKYEVGMYVMRETKNNTFFVFKICSFALPWKQQRYFVLLCLERLRSNPSELRNLNDDAL
jgi:hypothetical protein